MFMKQQFIHAQGTKHQIPTLKSSMHKKRLYQKNIL